MVSLKQVTRSIVVGSAIALSIVTLSNSASAGKKKIPYVCATGSDVVIRVPSVGGFQSIGKMSKGQCIKASINAGPPFAGEAEIHVTQNGQQYYGIDGRNRGHRGYVSTKFSKLTYR